MYRRIVTEIRQEEFDVSFTGDDEIPHHLRDVEYWIKRCFSLSTLKFTLLKFLYKPVPRRSVPREMLYKELSQPGYSEDWFRRVLKELESEGLVKTRNGVVGAVDHPLVMKNIMTVILLWPHANSPEKPRGALKDKKLRHYILLFLDGELKPLKLIVKEYCGQHGYVSRDAVKRALDEYVTAKIIECQITHRGKYKSHYYRRI